MKLKARFNIFCKKLYNNRANIAFYSGTALTMLGTVLSVKATRKNEAVITDHKLKMAITPEDDKETRSKICKNTVKETAKNYALAVGTSAVGYGLQIYSNTQHNKDLTLLNTALTGATFAYETLKEKYISEHGVDAWERLNGVTVDHVIDAETNEESLEVSIDPKKNTDIFSVVFDKNNRNFMLSKGDNRRFLIGKQNQVNADIDNYGIVMLTEVLTVYLGYKLSDFDPDWLKSISRAGWFVRKANKPTTYIDFGLQGNDVSEAVSAFMNDEVMEVKLIFNCEPDVYAAIKNDK